MSKRLQSYIYLTATAAIWGIGAVVIKVTLDHLEPFTFLAYRFILTGLVVIPLFLIELQKHGVQLKQIPEMIKLDFFGVVLHLCLIFIGIDLTSALEASVILSMVPIFTIIGGILFLREKVSKFEIWGVSIAVIGTALIVLEPIFSGESLQFANVTGNLILIGANITSTYFALQSKIDLRNHYNPWMITLVGFLIAPIFFIPLSILEQPLNQLPAVISSIPITAHLGVIYMSIISGIIAFYIRQLGFRDIDASEAGIFSYLNPVFGAPLAILWLNESINTVFIIGTFLIICGVILAEYKPLTRYHERRIPAIPRRHL